MLALSSSPFDPRQTLRLTLARCAPGGARQYGRLGAIASRHLKVHPPRFRSWQSRVAEIGDKEWKFRSAKAGCGALDGSALRTTGWASAFWWPKRRRIGRIGIAATSIAW